MFAFLLIRKHHLRWAKFSSAQVDAVYLDTDSLLCFNLSFVHKEESWFVHNMLLAKYGTSVDLVVFLISRGFAQ